MEEEASVNRQDLAWAQPEAAEAADIPVVPFVYLVLDNDLAQPLLLV